MTKILALAFPDQGDNDENANYLLANLGPWCATGLDTVVDTQPAREEIKS